LARTLELRRADGGEPLWRLEVADSWWQRLKGLIGRRELRPGAGLYLPGTNSIHMLLMRFPIDCAFVGPMSADGTRPVVSVHHGLRPWTGVVWWARGARGAVELPAGSLAAAGLKVGDRVRLEPT
jgi:uncharacterized protein